MNVAAAHSDYIQVYRVQELKCGR